VGQPRTGLFEDTGCDGEIVSYLVSPATLEDLPSMIEWEVELFGADAWAPEVMVAEVSHPHNHYIVARDGNAPEILGYAGVRCDPIPGGQGDIQTIAVIPKHRAKGLGRMMLQELLGTAQHRGVHQVFLEVRADNSVALALYESEGFQVIDRRVGYYQPDGVDALVMRIDLGSHARGRAVGHG